MKSDMYYDNVAAEKAALAARADEYNARDDLLAIEDRLIHDADFRNEMGNAQFMVQAGPRVLCQAIVDPLHEGAFMVTVTGLPPHDTKRIYAIVADSDNDAAKEGIERFVAEMSGG